MLQHWCRIGNIEVPRRAPRLLKHSAGLLMAAAGMLTVLPAGAQIAVANDPLLTPSLDGNPQPPPVFRNANAPPPAVTTLPVGQVQNFGYRGSIGVGSTGFDSSNARPKARPLGPPQDLTADSAPTGPDVAAPQLPAAAAPAATQLSLPPLPPPNAIGDARLTQNQNRTRHGASPLETGLGPTRNAAASRNAAAAGSPNASVAIPAPAVANDPAQGLPRPLVRRSVVDDKPFDPTGITAGAFRLRPAIEVSAGYDTNPARTPAGGGASDLAIVAPELQVNSNWSRHELAANLRGSYTAYGAQPSQDRPAFEGKIDGRIDVTGQTRVDLESRLLVATDNPGSPNIQVGLARLPIFTDVGGTLGLGQRFNRFDIALKGLVDRTSYQQSVFTDGTVGSNDDRNFDQFGTQLRAQYEVTPGVKPFVELDADQRRYDLTFDRSGFARDSNGHAGKLGSTFELSSILIGQVAFGHLTRSYADPRLPDLSGPTFDASLTWLASALTTVKLTAVTIANETTLAGASGAFTHEVGLEVDHAFRTWLELTLKLVGDRDDYVGITLRNDRYLASTALTYKLTREVWLKSELRREWQISNLPGNDYQAYVALVGVRLQR
jgi:hypothetical protein